MSTRHDSDEHKGVVEEEAPRGEGTRPSLSGQLGHRTGDPQIKDSDSDFPEPGPREEHTGERES